MMPKTTDPVDFIWKGKDKQGKVTKGEISAISEASARSELRRIGIRIIGIKKKPKAILTKAVKPIKAQDIAVFSRQLASMLSSGIPLVQSFDIIGKGHENPSMADLLFAIKHDIEEGDTLAQSLKKHPSYFDELYCNLIAAGERAGALEGLLDKIATYKEKTETLKKKIKKSLTYPITVIAVAVIVTAILLLFVVPVFKELFDGFGAELPGFTLWVMGISDWMVAYWYYLAGALIAAAYVFRYFKKRSPKFNHFLDRVLLKVPVFGAIVHKSTIARFSRTLATMSVAGIPLVEALESVAGATGNIVYYIAVMQMREDIATGQSLQYAMNQQAYLFPNMVIQMIAIGEESGTIDKMLNKVADFYEEEVDNMVDNLSTLMEPFIMVILGVLVGGLVTAMYLPIFKMGQVI